MVPPYWGVIGGIVLFFVIGVGFVIIRKISKDKQYGTYKPINLSKTKNKMKGGGIDMDKLEEDVFKEFEGAYNDIIEEIKRAEREKDGIDLKDFVKSQASRFKQLNNHFREAKIRMGGK